MPTRENVSEYSKYVGRVGALAVALGVGAAVATGYGMGVARADDATGAEESASVDSAADPAAPSSTDPVDEPSGDDSGDGDVQADDDPTDTEMDVDVSGGQDTSVNDDGQSTDAEETPVHDGDADADSDGEALESEPEPEPELNDSDEPDGDSALDNATPPPSDPPPADPADDDIPDIEKTDTTDGSGTRVLSRLSVASDDDDTDVRLLSVEDPETTTMLADAQLVEPQQALMGLPGAVVSIATTVVGAFLAPFLAPGPTAPAEPPLLWAVLGWVRREVARVQRTFFNHTPNAVGDTATTDEDTEITIDVLDNDADDDELTIASYTDPEHGTVVDNGDGTFTYTPDPDFAGTDSFTYTLSDAESPWHLHGLLSLLTGQRHSDTATVTVTVTGTPDNPVAGEDAYETEEETPLTITPPGVLGNDSDADDDDLTVEITDEPDNGTVELNSDGSFTYSPDENFTGTDEFTYTVSDGTGGTDTAEVTITVGTVNDDPVADDETFTAAEDTPREFTAADLLAGDTDIDGDTLTITDIGDPSSGTLQDLGNGTYRYTPAGDVTGSVTFSYTVSDGEGGTDIGQITIDVRSLEAIGSATLEGASPVAVVVGNDGKVYQAFTNRVGVFTVAVIDPADLDNPTLVELPGSASGRPVLRPDGTITYATPTGVFNSSRVIVVNLADPDNPTIINLSGSLGNENLTVGPDGTIYQPLHIAATDTEAVAVIDPTDPDNPTIVDVAGEIMDPVAIGAGGIAAVTTRALGSGGFITSVTVIDPTDPENFVTVDVPGDPSFAGAAVNPDGVVYQAFSRSGVTYAVVIDRDDPEFDPENPTVVQLAAGSGGIPAIGPDGAAYFTTREAGGDMLVTVIHPADPINPTFYTLPNAGGIIGNPAVGADGTIYQLTSDAGNVFLVVFDPTDQENPTVLDIPGSASGGAVRIGTDGTAYVISTTNTSSATTDVTHVTVIGPANPGNPTTINLPGRLSGLAATGPDGSAYVTTLSQDGSGNGIVVVHAIGLPPSPAEAM